MRAKIYGTKERPRLSVFRSHQHIHLQLIDDSKGETIVSASTLEAKSAKGKGERASAVAKLLSERALAAGIKQAVFDRGGYKYHGQVKLVAEKVKEGGLSV